VRFLVIVFIASFMGVYSATAQDRFVFEGVFDVPLLDGTFIPTDCKTGTPFESDYLPEKHACIAYPFADAQDSPEWTYVKALDEAGWKFAGGAANVYYLEKSIDDDCSTRMYMIGVIQGAPEEVAKWGNSDEADMDWAKIENGIYQFMLEGERVCGDKRYLKDDEDPAK